MKPRARLKQRIYVLYSVNSRGCSIVFLSIVLALRILLVLPVLSFLDVRLGWVESI